MIQPIVLTCAVTGGADVAARYPQVPVTPKEIAQACVEAACAGAAIVHIHVRNPDTGKPSMDLELYREVVDRIRNSGTDVIINLTTGPGARYVPELEKTNIAASGSNVRPAQERVQHILEIKPEICSLDMGSLNFGAGALINTPPQIEIIAKGIREAGVKPELEVFDTGHLALAHKMIADGLIDDNPLFQFALGIPWGAPANAETMVFLKNSLPAGALWAAFGVGRSAYPTLAQSALLGGHIRVGMEDNFFLENGVQARSNAELVEKANRIIKVLGGSLASPREARELLGIPAQ